MNQYNQYSYLQSTLYTQNCIIFTSSLYTVKDLTHTKSFIDMHTQHTHTEIVLQPLKNLNKELCIR